MKIYQIEQWADEDEPCRQSFVTDTLFLGKFSYLREFSDEEYFRSELKKAIDNCAVITKVAVIEVPDDYWNKVTYPEIPEYIKLT